MKTSTVRPAPFGDLPDPTAAETESGAELARATRAALDALHPQLALSVLTALVRHTLRRTVRGELTYEGLAHFFSEQIELGSPSAPTLDEKLQALLSLRRARAAALVLLETPTVVVEARAVFRDQDDAAGALLAEKLRTFAKQLDDTSHG